MTKLRISFSVFTTLLLMLSLAAVGQTFRGAISGAVTDVSGAVVSGATVKAVSASTGLARETISSASGEFAFQDLPLGKYTVTISQPGFQTVRVDNVDVEVGKVLTLPVKLSVAQQATTVEVTASTVALDTESTALNAVIPDKAVQEVPLVEVCRLIPPPAKYHIMKVDPFFTTVPGCAQ